MTFDTTADFYLDFRKGINPWEGLMERLIFEGILKTSPDGLSDFEMAGIVKANKNEWLKWVSDRLNAGEYEQLGLGRQDTEPDAPDTPTDAPELEPEASDG